MAKLISKKYLFLITICFVFFVPQDIFADNHIYIRDGNSLKRTEVKNVELDEYKGEPKDEVSVTIGDENKAEFIPSIEIKRWNEASFKLVPNLNGTIIKEEDFTFEGDKIKFETPQMNFEIYDVPEGEGGYKYIWYLKEKPATNIIEFNMEAEGLDFSYQPPLTEEYQNGYSEEYKKEIVVSETQVKDLEGNIILKRPENVVGSYAVFYSTRGGMNDKDGKEYKIGKAFHIYRPHVIDAEGKETWGILKIENDIYSVEIPQEFLDKAIYPIKSNDTFGYTTVGASNETEADWVNDYIIALAVDCPASGTLTKITVYDYPGDDDYGWSAKVALYNSSGGRLTSGADTSMTTDYWHEGAVSYSLEATTYWLAARYWLSDAHHSARYDTLSNAGRRDPAGVYGEFPADWSSATVNNKRYSIYATYISNNTAPNVPASLGPASYVDGSWTSSTQPTLTFTQTDSDESDTVKYTIQISTSSDYSINVVDYTSTLLATGSASFTVGQAAGDGTYATGTSSQTLSDGSYYWRVMSTDNNDATSSWTVATDTVAFRVDSIAPDVPSISSITADSSSQLTVITSTSSDADSGLSATPYYLIEVSDNEGGSSFDWQASTTFVDTDLATNTEYIYSTKARDEAGNESDYSATSSKYTLAPTPTSFTGTKSNVDGVPSMTLSIASLSNATSGSSGYYFYREDGTINSGWIQTNSWQDTMLDCNASYNWYVRYRNGDGVETATTSLTQETVSCPVPGPDNGNDGNDDSDNNDNDGNNDDNDDNNGNNNDGTQPGPGGIHQQKVNVLSNMIEIIKSLIGLYFQLLGMINN